MKKALDNYVIRGVTHNVSLCHDILRCDKFIEGDMTTNYLYEKYPDGFKGHQLRDREEEDKLASMFAALAVSRQLSQRNVLSNDSFSVNVDIAEVGEREAQVNYNSTLNTFDVTVGEHTFNLSADIPVDQDKQILNFSNGDVHTIQTYKNSASGDMTIQYLGTLFSAKTLPSHIASYAKLMPEKPKIDESLLVKTPMPGTVISVAVSEGEKVVVGQEVAVLEAMKMQNSLTAQCDGVVKALHCKEGDKMSDGDLIVELQDLAAVAE